MNLLEAYASGGAVMHLLALLSVVALSLVLFSMARLHSMRRQSGEWLSRIESALDGPLEGASEVSLGRALQRVSFGLQSAILWLSRLAGMATLLGLLGTVLGISQAFADMQISGQAGPDVFAGGIYKALHTTIAGLALALPFLLAHHLLKDALSIRQLELLSRLERRS